MRALKLALLSLFLFTLPAGAEPILYLVRHAEKASDDTSDPALTPEGEARAQWLAAYFKNRPLTQVFSTDYKRTQQTAAPTAEAAGLAVESYDPRDLEAFAKKLADLQGVILVTGHSNTTPILAGILMDEPMEELDERVYDHIYILSPTEHGYKLDIDHSQPLTPSPDGE